MKKLLFIIFLSLIFCNTAFTESYYFKECKLSENASGDYLIDFDNNDSSVNVIITLYDNCFNEFILDENYLVQGENEINLDEFDNGYYNMVIKENENDNYLLLNRTFFIEDDKYFLCYAERIIPPPIK